MSNNNFYPLTNDNPQLYKRLNHEMVRAFWELTPEKNRGKYIEDIVLPHAFVRDGDVLNNEKELLNYWRKL